MDFFASQESARRRTRRLLAYYALAVLGMVAAFYFASRAIAWLVRVGMGPEEAGHNGWVPGNGFRIAVWDPFWMAVTAGVTLTVILGATLWRRATLAEGGAAVARSAGGREIGTASPTAEERRLLNVVEEMALACGVPVPRVFVLDGEPGINAFAAGFTLRDAAIAVTRGALDRLNRDELQGVIAHEYSHILNGDMRLNSWLLGVLFGILVTSVCGRLLMQTLRFARFSGSRKKGGGGGVVLVLFLSGLALWVIGSIGVLFGRLIQAAVSRQREFLADASAVQFTRNPAGLAGALKRIGAMAAGGRLRCANRSELSHLLFDSPVRAGFSGRMASHPPLVSRIRRLEPAFDGDFRPWGVRPAATVTRSAEKTGSGLGTAAGIPHLPGTGRGMIGALAFLERLAPELRASLTQADAAGAALYGLLFQEEEEIRGRQRARVAAAEGEVLAGAAERWFAALRGRDRTERRRIFELAVAAARGRPAPARERCIRLVRELAAADAQVSLFEFMLQNRVARGLAPERAVREAARAPVPPARVGPEAARLLGMLARAGQPHDASAAAEAWRAGAVRATSFGVGTEPPACETFTADGLEEILARLNGLIPLLKGELLRACAAVVRADGARTPDETELLRAVADRLDLPLPALDTDAPAQ